LLVQAAACNLALLIAVHDQARDAVFAILRLITALESVSGSSWASTRRSYFGIGSAGLRTAAGGAGSYRFLQDPRKTLWLPGYPRSSFGNAALGNDSFRRSYHR
jgi:hypothetical protein